MDRQEVCVEVRTVGTLPDTQTPKASFFKKSYLHSMHQNMHACETRVLKADHVGAYG